MIEFVLAKENDAPIIAKLRQRVWAETYCDIYPAEMIDHFDFGWHAQQDLGRIRNPGYLVYLITKDGKSIGYLTLKIGKPLILLSLYILQENQRQGIGKQAFALIHRYCREKDVAAFICQCQPDNKPAMAFYHTMGGIITESDDENVESWQNSVTFSFPINEMR